LILVDSDSTDDTREVMKKIAESYDIPIKIIHCKLKGVSLARRCGAKIATNEILVFLDDDCYPQRDYFRTVLSIFENESVDYCGGRILLYDDSDIKYTVQYYEEKVNIPAKSFIPAGLIQGGNLVFRKDALLNIGNFNPHIGAGRFVGGEDVEIVGRASIKGCQGAYLPQLVVRHDHGRKHQTQIQPVKRRYSIGRGAYYASLLCNGSLKLFIQGYKRSISIIIKHHKIKKIKDLFYECIGAVLFLFYVRAKMFIVSSDGFDKFVYYDQDRQ